MDARLPFLPNEVPQPYTSYNPDPYSSPLSSPDAYGEKSPYISVQQAPVTPTQLPAPRSLLARWRNFVYRTWLMEFIAILIAFLFLTLILAVCAVYHNHIINLDDSGFFTTPPNSILNILVSVMRTAMLLPVASGIAQLKWSWYRNRNKLDDMESFDEAARGVVGSLHILRKPRLWGFVLVGAVLTICCLVLETIVALAIYPQWVGPPLSAEESLGYITGVARTNRYEWYHDASTNSQVGGQLPIAAAMSGLNLGIGYGTGLLQTSDMDNLQPNCESGACDFGPYQTISVDYICEDISDKVQSNGNFHYLPANDGLPAVLPLSAENGKVVANTTFLYPDPDWFPSLDRVGPLITNTYILGSYNDGHSTPFALECAVFWSVQTLFSNTTSYSWMELPYNDTVSAAKIPSNWTDTSEANRTRYRQTNDIIMTPPACFVNGTLIHKPYADRILDPVDSLSECVYKVDALAQLGLQNYLISGGYGLQGMTEYELCAGCSSSTTDFATYLSQIMDQSVRTNATENIALYMFSNLCGAFDTTLRLLGRRVPVTSFNTDDTGGWYTMPAQGVMKDFPKFRVRWVVMTYPTAMIMCCALFAFGVALRERQHVWKRSSLPLLFHGLSSVDRAAVGEILDYAGMKERAASMDVVFQNTPEGYRFVRHA